MSDLTLAVSIVVAGALGAIVLWQVLEIGKERSRDGTGDHTPLARKVQELEERIASLELRGPGGHP